MDILWIQHQVPGSRRLPKDCLNIPDDVTGRSIVLERTARENFGDAFIATVNPMNAPNKTPTILIRSSKLGTD